jgi:hypothetical protein
MGFSGNSAPTAGEKKTTKNTDIKTTFIFKPRASIILLFSSLFLYLPEEILGPIISHPKRVCPLFRYQIVRSRERRKWVILLRGREK